MERTDGRALTPWQDLGAVTAPTCSPPRTLARRTIPRAIHETVGELKVRFQHGSGGDPEGFRARAALLAEDLADVPPDLLRTAAAAWVREQPFMPTAADLTRLMRQELERRDARAAPANPKPGFDPAQSFCDQRNAALTAKPRDDFDDIEWIVDSSGEPRLRYKPATRTPCYDPSNPDRCDPAEVKRLNGGLCHGGAHFRFDPNGYPVDVAIIADEPSEHVAAVQQ